MIFPAINLFKFATLISSINLELYINDKFEVPTNIYSFTIARDFPEEDLRKYYNLGNSYLMNAQFDEALEQFNKALIISPHNSDVLLSRGIVNEKLFKWKDAIEDYKESNSIIKKRPFSADDPTCISNLANAETGLNLWEDALRDYTYAIKLDPKFIAPQLGRNLVLYELGRKDESLVYFQNLAKKFPDFPDGQAALAVMQFEKGLLSDASDSWETALEGDSRYLDIDWVQNIRRWPPSLVATLQNFIIYLKSVR